MTQVEITFLGTTAAIPTKYRNHAAIHVRYQSENEYCLLFDCGEGTQKQIFSAGLNFMRINDIFITHWHADHFAGLLGLMQTMNMEKRNKELRIYGPEASKFVAILRELGYSVLNYPVNSRDVIFEGQETEKLLENDEFEICSIPMVHGIPAVAYAFQEKHRVKIDKTKTKKAGLPEKGYIYKKLKDKGSVIFKGTKIFLEDISIVEKGKKVVYTGDTKANKNTVRLAEGADLLIHDSTFFENNFEGASYKHATIDNVIKLAREAHVKDIILTHISRRYQDANDLKDKIKKYSNVRLAKDFMKITLK